MTIPAPGGTPGRAHPAGGRPRPRVEILLRGTFTIPAVAYDGSASGLSGDRRTLVLIEPRTSFPRVATSLLVLHARTLAYRSLVKLPGDFSFDAVSPDGSRLYLIQYLSPTDPTRYAVRGFDLASMRLTPKRIVDPREPDETMRGNPLSRADERRRTVGVHPLRRRWSPPVHPRARHGDRDRTVHRPQHALAGDRLAAAPAGQ